MPTHEPDDPPRLPLRIWVAAEIDGAMVDGSSTLPPDDPDYERNYQRAARDFREFGIPIPYADEDAAQEPPGAL